MAIALNNWSKVLDASWSPRRLARAVYHNNYVYIAGGLNELDERLSDVWRTSDFITWEYIKTDVALRRSGFGFLYFDNKFWVFGGSNDSGPLNDVWSSPDCITWTLITLNADWWERHEFSCCVFDNKMWIVGGFQAQYSMFLSDVWSSTDGITWTQTTTNFGQLVREHVMVNFLNKMWIYGGDIGTNYLNTIYSSSNGITWNNEGNAAWTPRRELSCLKTSFEDRLIITSGTVSGGSAVNDVWESTDGVTWTEITQINSYTSRYDSIISDNGLFVSVMSGDSGTIDNDVWIASFFNNVTYFGNGNISGTPPIDSSEYTIGQSVTVLSGNDLVKGTRTFLHWNTQIDNNGTSYSPGDVFLFNGSMILFAIWTTGVTYNGNGNTAGSVPIDPNLYDSGETITILGNTGSLAKTNYSFSGWNTNPISIGIHYEVNDLEKMGSSELELYTEWGQYQVTFDGNGSTSGSVIDSRLYSSNSYLTFPEPGSLQKQDSDFYSWSVDSVEGSGIDFFPGDTYKITGNITFYAKWLSSSIGGLVGSIIT